MLATVIERFIFLSRVNVAKYSNIHSLEIDLNRNMTTISNRWRKRSLCRSIRNSHWYFINLLSNWLSWRVT